MKATTCCGEGMSGEHTQRRSGGSQNAGLGSGSEPARQQCPRRESAGCSARLAVGDGLRVLEEVERDDGIALRKDEAVTARKRNSSDAGG